MRLKQVEASTVLVPPTFGSGDNRGWKAGTGGGRALRLPAGQSRRFVDKVLHPLFMMEGGGGTWCVGKYYIKIEYTPALAQLTILNPIFRAHSSAATPRLAHLWDPRPCNELPKS